MSDFFFCNIPLCICCWCCRLIWMDHLTLVQFKTWLNSRPCLYTVYSRYVFLHCRLIHIGQFLNGLGGPIAMGGPPLISATWFPVHQRTTATALMVVIAGFGLALSFIIAPLIVPDVGDAWKNGTRFVLSSFSSSFLSSFRATYCLWALTKTDRYHIYIASSFSFLLVFLPFPLSIV